MRHGDSSGLFTQMERLLAQIECLAEQVSPPEDAVDPRILAALLECRRILSEAVPGDAAAAEGQ
jgi:hypothetical protein